MKAEWADVASFSGQGSVKTKPFALVGGEQEVAFKTVAGDEGGAIVTIYNPDLTSPDDYIDSLTWMDGGNHETSLYLPAGRYYLDIDCPAKWSVEIRELR